MVVGVYGYLHASNHSLCQNPLEITVRGDEGIRWGGSLFRF